MRFVRVLHWPVLLSCVFLSAVGAAAQPRDYCALSVELQSSDGSPARLTPVRLLDPSGKAVFDEQVDGSTFEICDFGFGEHTLIVGYKFCHPTTISKLQLRFDDPIRLTVRLQPCQRDVWNGGCEMYLRLRDSAGPLGGVSVVWENGVPSSISDRFGRVHTLLPPKTSTTIHIAKDGFEAQETALSCLPEERIEREVTLRRRP
jgi:hypothetical protein